jgi:hypothetical protein
VLAYRPQALYNDTVGRIVCLILEKGMAPMKYLFRGVAVGLAGLVLMVGCGPADVNDAATVTPVLVGRPSWTAGQPNLLRVRLEAAGQDGTSLGPLGFQGIPAGANPKATITFYQGDVAQPPLTVALDHRCCGGMYSSPGDGIDVPSAATKAVVVVTGQLSRPGLTQNKLETVFEIHP